MTDEQLWYEIDPETVEGAGAEPIKPSSILHMGEEDRARWIKAMEGESESLCRLDVKEDLTQDMIYERYWRKETKTVKLPCKMVTVKKYLHDGTGGWKAKARCCVCGIFEEGYGGDIRNRSEVPATFELRTMLAMSQEEAWSLGALDVTTAFVHAELVDTEDGIYLIAPPQILITLGLVAPGTTWKLKRVLYGLTSGPKRWGEKRDFEMARAKFVTEDGNVAICEPGIACSTCWTVKCKGKTVARFLVYVDDIVVSGPVVWAKAVFEDGPDTVACQDYWHHVSEP